MLFYCDICIGLTKSQKFKTINDWMEHLISHQHQLNAQKELLSWSSEQNERSWVILNTETGMKLDKSLTLNRLIAHFCKYGFISDLLLEDDAKFAVVQIDLPEVLRSKQPCLQSGEHLIEGIKVLLHRKLDISESLWSSILGTEVIINKASTITQTQTALATETKKTKMQSDLPPRLYRFKEKSRRRDDNVNSSHTSSSASPSPIVSVPSLTFYSKNMPTKNFVSVGVKVENQQKINQNENREQTRKVPKMYTDKERGNSNSQAVLHTTHSFSHSYQQPLAATNASKCTQRSPEFRDYYHLFVELLKLPMHLRQNHNFSKEFRYLNANDQLVCFMNSVTMTQEDGAKRVQLLQELTELIRKRFPKSILYPFGSMSSGLGDHDSDIDIYVDVFGETSGIHVNPYENRRQTKQEIMMEIRKLLKGAKFPTNRPMYGKIIPVLSARVPILKFHHNRSKINVDLSFENLLSFQNTKMISFIMTLDECVRPLLLLVRYWGRFHELTGSTLIKNYGFTLMVLVFLSLKGIIPTVYHLQSLIKVPYCIDGWNAGFCENRTTVLNSFPKTYKYETVQHTGRPTTRSILLLAQEFFHTFAHIDFSTAMVCSLTSEIIPKINFSPGNEENLPQTLERYKNWSARQKVGHRLNINTPLVLQDPFLLSFNVGGVTPEGTLLKFQVACAQTSAILKENLKCLLDGFVHLPKQVGEKKFMAMQRIHKKHEELKQEVKDALGYRVSTDSKTETVPIHLLPLDQIISKKTIQYGHGWETFLHYSLGDSTSKTFQQLFRTELECLSLTDLVRPVDLENKMKALWVTFVNEFLLEVWVPCFGIAHTLEKAVIPLRRFMESKNGKRSRRDRHPSLNVDTDNANVDVDQVEVENLPSASDENQNEDETDPSVKSSQERNALIEKLSCVAEQQFNVSYYKFKCTADVPFWPKREFHRKTALKKLSVENRQDFLSDSLDEPVELKKAKRKDSKRKRDKLNKCMLDPLVIEQKVMDLINEGDGTAQENTNHSDKIVFQCNCLIKLDASYLNDWPEVFLLLEKDSCGFTQNYVAGGTAITTTLKKLFPAYMLHKLIQWFAVEGVSDTESTNKMETRINHSDIVFTFSDSEDEDKNEIDSCDTEENDIKTPSALSFHDSSEEN